MLCVEHDSVAHPFRVVSGGHDKQLKIWDLRRPEACVATVAANSAAIFALQFDENKVIAGTADQTVKVFRFNHTDGIP